MAVIAVLIFHAAPSFFPNGYLGVDVFFVISGYVVYPLILRIVRGTSFSIQLQEAKIFYLSRFYRLAPAIGSVITVFILLTFFLISPDEHIRVAKQAISSLLIVGNFGAYKYSGDYFNPRANPLIHTWSLSIEEQIYLLMPVYLVFIRPILLRKKITRDISLIAPIFLISLIIFLNPNSFSEIYAKYGIEIASQLNFYSPISRLWEFLLGCIVFTLREKHFGQNKIIGSISISSLAAIIFFVKPIDQGLGILLITLLTAIFLNSNNMRIRNNKISNEIKKLGDRSYSIYLIHMPIIYILNYSLFDFFYEYKLLNFFLSVTLTLYISKVLYYKIESKYRLKGKQINTSRKTAWQITLRFIVSPILLAILMIAGSATSYWGLNKNDSQPPYAGHADPKCERDSYSGPPCQYGSRDFSKQVLLIGDSHAGHFSQVVVDAALNANWKAIIWTHSGCRFQLTNYAKSPLHANCLSVNNQIIDFISDKKPDLIILSQALPGIESVEDLKLGLSMLSKKSPSIYMVEETPIFPDGGNFLKSKPILLGKPKYERNFSIDDMVKVNSETSKEINAFATSVGIKRINLNSLFCDDFKCVRWKDGNWLFIDGNHLSIFGANLGKEIFINLLKEENE